MQLQRERAWTLREVVSCSLDLAHNLRMGCIWLRLPTAHKLCVHCGRLLSRLLPRG